MALYFPLSPTPFLPNSDHCLVSLGVGLTGSALPNSRPPSPLHKAKYKHHSALSGRAMPVRVDMLGAPLANTLQENGREERGRESCTGHLPALAFLVDFVNVLFRKPILLRDLEENGRGFIGCCPKWMCNILLYHDFHFPNYESGMCPDCGKIQRRKLQSSIILFSRDNNHQHWDVFLPIIGHAYRYFYVLCK